MREQDFYRSIVEKYPDTMSKEQLCKLCHISKRRAKYYLDHQIIPCKNNGKATHKYEIQTTDVVDYLRAREKKARKYQIKYGSLTGDTAPAHPSIVYTPQVMRVYKQLLIERSSSFPDLMSIEMVAELTGYSTKTVLKWTSMGHIRWFKKGNKYFAPKELVLEHMLSKEYRSIHYRCQTHDELIYQLLAMTTKGVKEDE